MISVMIANNETGVIQPIEKIGSFVERKELFFIQMQLKQ